MIKTPYGIDQDGLLVHASKALRTSIYRCPGCKRVVIPRHPRHAQVHFCHKSTAECSGETVAHNTAKHLIAKAFNDALHDTTSSVCIDHPCDVCKRAMPRSPALVYSRAEIEHTLPSGLRPDVALLHGDMAVGAVEVYWSHAVDAHKERALNIPWIEVEAKEILKTCSLLRPRAGKWFRDQPWESWKCGECHRRTAGFHAVRRAIGKKTGQPIIDLMSHILTVPYRCRHCRRAVLVYVWTPGKTLYDANYDAYSNSDPPELDTPSTLQTSQFSKDLVNTCYYCKAAIHMTELLSDAGGPCWALKVWLHGHSFGETVSDGIIERLAYCMEKSGQYDFSLIHEGEFSRPADSSQESASP